MDNSAVNPKGALPNPLLSIEVLMKNDRLYQFNFSQILPQAMFDHSSRQKKALTILSVLSHHQPSGLEKLSVLDIGSSTGIIADYLATHFHQVCGIDIDQLAVRFAKNHCMKPNLHFLMCDSLNICFAENCFDAIICAQVYEHVPDAELMMKEIFRVLKPGGVCYFAAGNRLSLMEPHYRLPLLSVVPRPVAHLYVRLAGKAPRYHERHRTYWGLKRLVHAFEVIDYTKRIINASDVYHANYMLPEHSARTRIAKFVVRAAYCLCPGYVWLLKKPQLP